MIPATNIFLKVWVVDTEDTYLQSWMEEYYKMVYMVGSAIAKSDWHLLFEDILCGDTRRYPDTNILENIALITQLAELKQRKPTSIYREGKILERVIKFLSEVYEIDDFCKTLNEKWEFYVNLGIEYTYNASKKHPDNQNDGPIVEMSQLENFRVTLKRLSHEYTVMQNTLTDPESAGVDGSIQLLINCDNFLSNIIERIDRWRTATEGQVFFGGSTSMRAEYRVVELSLKAPVAKIFKTDLQVLLHEQLYHINRIQQLLITLLVGQDNASLNSFDLYLIN
jgi:hypothetical protein